jgi:hypothetical protein
MKYFLLTILFWIVFGAFIYHIDNTTRVDYWSVSEQRCVDCINCSCDDITAPGPLTTYVK